MYKKLYGICIVNCIYCIFEYKNVRNVPDFLNEILNLKNFWGFGDPMGPLKGFWDF